MEIFPHTFLFFWIEKKLFLLSHVRSIEYMTLIIWLWSLELKVNAFHTKIVLFGQSYFLIVETFCIIIVYDCSSLLYFVFLYFLLLF